MKASIEISMYPLQTDFIPPIADFIERLNQNPEVEVHTNALSTQIFGDFNVLMELLQKEIGQSFSAGGQQIFVLKILNGHHTYAG